MQLIWCKNCLLPNTRPNLIIQKWSMFSMQRFSKKKIQIGKKEKRV